MTKVQLTKDNIVQIVDNMLEMKRNDIPKAIMITEIANTYHLTAADAKRVVNKEQLIMDMYDMLKFSGENAPRRTDFMQKLPTDNLGDSLKELKKALGKNTDSSDDEDEETPRVVDEEDITDDDDMFENPSYADDFVSNGELRLIVAIKAGREIEEMYMNAEFDKKTLDRVYDRFYQAQRNRIRLGNQINAIRIDSIQEKINLIENTMKSRGIIESEAIRICKPELDNIDRRFTISVATLRMEENVYRDIESTYGKLLDIVTSKDAVCIWMRKIIGIGHIYAAGLRAHLDITRPGVNYATNFISYAGLNDRYTPWLSQDKIAKISAECWQELGDTKRQLSKDFMVKFAAKTGRTYEKVLKACTTRYDQKLHKRITLKAPSYSAFLKNMAMKPYNGKLKTLMFKIADRFNKMPSETRSLYTMIMMQRKVIETRRNENGEFAEYAAKMLREKKYGDDKTVALLSRGYLPKGQIQLRAYRIANKVLLSHVFEAMYIYHYGKYPARYYSLDILGHQDEILPEIPYDELFDAYEARTGKKADRYREVITIDRTSATLRNRVESVVKRSYDVDTYYQKQLEYQKQRDDALRDFFDCVEDDNIE